MSERLAQEENTQSSVLSPQSCLVMKFGGTSVGGGRQLRAVAAIVEDHRAERPVVVASAMRGVTDRLLAAAGAAGRGQRGHLLPQPRPPRHQPPRPPDQGP